MEDFWAYDVYKSLTKGRKRDGILRRKRNDIPKVEMNDGSMVLPEVFIYRRWRFLLEEKHVSRTTYSCCKISRL